METNDITLIVLVSIGLPLEAYFGFIRGKFGEGPLTEHRDYSRLESRVFSFLWIFAAIIPASTGFFLEEKIEGTLGILAGIGIGIVYFILCLIAFAIVENYAEKHWNNKVLAKRLRS